MLQFNAVKFLVPKLSAKSVPVDGIDFIRTSNPLQMRKISNAHYAHTCFIILLCSVSAISNLEI